MAEQSHSVSTPCLAAAVLSPTASSSRAGSNVARIQRNVAEKQRRDKLNGYISELANIVPMISKSSRRLDKTSILRLSAAHLRICKSSLATNGKTKKTFTWCPNFFSNDQIRDILESVDGFLIITSSNGKILFTSRGVERYLGHQDIDMIGHSLYMFIHEKDVDDIKQKMRDMLTECLEKGSSRRSFECLMKEKAQPRSEVSTYQHVHFVGGMTAADDPTSEKPKSVITHMFKAFVKIVDMSPYSQLSLEEATADEYVTRHSLDGTIIYADHRLATITGHMPNEVIGLSAYEYIHKDDMAIALFAHHLMFSSDKGTGIIVYRLATRDNRYVYLKSVGCLQYDNATQKVDHFVCINQQLGDSDGDLQLKYFFDRYIPQVKGNSIKMLLESIQALQLSTSSPTSHNKAVASVNSDPKSNLSATSSPEGSSSTMSSLSPESPKSGEENSPDTVMEHCNDSEAPRTRVSLPGSSEYVHRNGSASPRSSVPSPKESGNKEKDLGTVSATDDSDCIIANFNGSSSGLVNAFFTSTLSSPLSVNQSHSVNTSDEPPLQISRNPYSLNEGPNNHVHNNLGMVTEPVVFVSDGSTCPSTVEDDTILQVDAQYEYVEALGGTDQNQGDERYLFLKSAISPYSESKNPIESGEKIPEEMSLYVHQMNGKSPLAPNGISSEDSSSHGEINLYDHQVNGKSSSGQNGVSSEDSSSLDGTNVCGCETSSKSSLSQSEFSSEDSRSPLGAQCSSNHADVFHEDTVESLIKHSSFIKNTNGLHSTLTAVNPCDSDSVLRNSKWSVDSFSVFQSTVKENSTLSMDYCDTMPTTESGDISLQEDLSSLLSATLPHSDSNSLPSANGWNDIFNPTEYSSPFGSEAALQKDEEQLLISSSKVKSPDLW